MDEALRRQLAIRTAEIVQGQKAEQANVADSNTAAAESMREAAAEQRKREEAAMQYVRELMQTKDWYAPEAIREICNENDRETFPQKGLLREHRAGDINPDNPKAPIVESLIALLPDTFEEFTLADLMQVLENPLFVREFDNTKSDGISPSNWAGHEDRYSFRIVDISAV